MIAIPIYKTQMIILLINLLTITLIDKGEGHCLMKNIESFKIEGIGDSYMEYRNGEDLIKLNGKVYGVLWKIKDGATGSAESTVVFSSIGVNNWTKFDIKGKAFILPDNEGEEIYAIIQEKDYWKIDNYTLDGKIVNSLKHKYRKFPKEYYHYTPLPILKSNNNLILHSIYFYETRSAIVGGVLNLVSGGHGWKPKKKSYIEVVPSKIKDSITSDKISVFEITDSSFKKTVSTTRNENIAPKIWSNSKTEKFKDDSYLIKLNMNSSNFYDNDKYISVNKNIQSSTNFEDWKFEASLPSFPESRYDNDMSVNHVGNHQTSDVFIDQKGNIYYSFNHLSMKCRDSQIYIYFFDRENSKWETNILHFDESLMTLKTINTNIFQNYFYIILRQFPTAAQIIFIDINDLKQGLNFKISNS